MDAMSTLNKNRSEHRCNICKQKGHIARDCVWTTCTYCSKPGHSEQRCIEKEAFRKIALWFTPELDIFCAIANEETRKLIDARTYECWAKLPQLSKWQRTGISVTAKENYLIAEFDPSCNIVITLQVAGSKRATQVFANRQRVKIAQKYVIEGTVISEDTARNAIGSESLKIPKADFYILIVAKGLFDSVVSLRLNERRYYLQWRKICENNVWREAVYVQTELAFEHEQSMKTRPAICNPREYFLPTAEPHSTVVHAEPTNASSEENSEPPRKLVAM